MLSAPFRALAIVLAAFFLAAQNASAQTSRRTEPEANTPTAAEAKEEEAAEPAVDLSVTYTADLWSVADGGLARGERYLDNLDVTLKVDAERALGWRGATLFAYGLYNNGRPLSADLIGDIQTTSNIETGVKAVRLYEFWVEQRFAGDRGSVKLGLYDLNSEFDTTGSGALFLSSSHGVGPDLSQTGDNGPSIFPVTSLAIRGDLRLSERVLLRAAVLDAVPGDPDRPRRTAIRLGGGDGALLITEAEYQDPATKVAIGVWHYTARRTPLDETLAPRGGNDGLYGLVERKLLREANDEDQGLSGWLRVGIANGEINPISRYFGGGLVYTGPFAGRDEDQVGAAFALATLGDTARRLFALPSDELAFELTYRAPLTEWLTVQPDVQYIVNPAGASGLNDALAIGLRLEVGF